ncbi:hypothetical protein [Agrilutibacter solisilvae]|uniref:Uncharacterized protein n=1 Tax=Agrilutibacter solisilvae TaxID=2763317 RepID=A0A975ASA6_9GAMM|nr:hypothetical protein [Lysobacter solisilvae]QSX77770.1 hypothetical protein I8J32_013680 [Lysobacter solisilvae]
MSVAAGDQKLGSRLARVLEQGGRGGPSASRNVEQVDSQAVAREVRRDVDARVCLLAHVAGLRVDCHDIH